jgi:hypothetical protein
LRRSIRNEELELQSSHLAKIMFLVEQAALIELLKDYCRQMCENGHLIAGFRYSIGDMHNAYKYIHWCEINNSEE